MKPIEIRKTLSASNPKALLADGLDEALIGIGRRCSQPNLAVYDVRKIISILKKRDKMTTEQAEEFFEFNIVGAWMGENTPIFLER